MNLYVRDLTADKDMQISVPYTESPLIPGHEYIILDGDEYPLELQQFGNIDQINDLLKKIEDSGYSTEAVKAIGKSYLFSEIKEAFERYEEPFEVIEINDEYIADKDEACGYTLYENGISYLPFEVPEDAVDYIKWDQNWYAAESDGWRVSGSYLIKRM